MESGTTVQSNSGEVRVIAGNDVNARGAYIGSETGGVTVAAGNNVNLTSSEDRSYMENYLKVKSGGFLKKKTTTSLDIVATTTNQGTTLSGDTVNVVAGNDINVKGSNVVSTQGTNLLAGNDVNITAATDTVREDHFKKTKKSGVFSGGSFGVTIGSQMQSVDNDSTQTYASASTIGSIAGNVNIAAGNRYFQEGSHVQAPIGDINITAKKVDITEARDTSINTSERRFKQTGITVNLSNPVITAVQTAQQMNDASKKTDDGRMKTLANLTTGLAAYNGYIQATDPANGPAGGLNISVSLGTSKSQSNSTASGSSAASSTVTAGNNINISATGGGKESNLTIQGSEVAAGNDVTLKADNDVNLLAAANTYEQHSTNKNSSASVGVSFSVGGDKTGISFQLAAAKGRGNADGSDLSWSNTHVTAGNQLNISSSNDTNLIGAVAQGKQVTVDVGNNLNIASLQDVSTYDSKQKNAGFSANICVPPLCTGLSSASISMGKTKVKGDYASVVEQSGIKAGDEGFKVNVKGNTSLDGAIIASTDKAVEDGKNSLTTGTLTTSDIQNHADASAKSSGISLSTDMMSGKYGATKGVLENLLNNSKSSESNSGETRSAVSEGKIVITDEAKQLEKTGQTATETIASLNRDTENAHTAANKIDVQALQDKVEAERSIKVALFKETVKFSDEAYKKMFLTNVDILKVERDKDGKTVLNDDGTVKYTKLTDEEKNNLEPGKNGKIQFANNGIFNSPEDAARLADQHDQSGQNVYVIYSPETNNKISEMMVAGYQRFMEGDLLGLSNATLTNINLMQQYGDSAHFDNHSRGSLTYGNAIESMAKNLSNYGTLSGTTATFYGAPYDVVKADANLAKLQGRENMTPEQRRVAEMLYAAHFLDPVAAMSGNPPTGGTATEGKSELTETLKVMGGERTAHNCYGAGGERCLGLWNNDLSILKPASWAVQNKPFVPFSY